MAWSVPLTAVSNATLTAAQWNASVRDNLLETAPAKAAAAGQIFVSTGVNQIAARSPSRATNAGAGTTTSVASYGDLSGTGVGPERTLTTGTGALVFMTAAISNSVAGGSGMMSFAVSGATTIAASDDRSLRIVSSNANETQRLTVVHHQVALNAGSNTFTLKYTTHSGGTATFQLREIGVIPL